MYSVCVPPGTGLGNTAIKHPVSVQSLSSLQQEQTITTVSWNIRCTQYLSSESGENDPM